MAAPYERKETKTLYIKEAPDAIIEKSGSEEKLRSEWKQRNEELASQGMRVIAAGSMRSYASGKDKRPMRTALSEGFEILGLFGIIDPPRSDVKQAINEAQAAGIGIIMITGDHPKTASHIAGQVGIENSDQVLTGPQMDEMDDEQFAEAIKKVSPSSRGFHLRISCRLSELSI
jgi:Ca2+-transporting ATPase